MNIIIFSVIMAALFALVMTVKFACEMHANNERIRKGSRRRSTVTRRTLRSWK